MYSQYYNITIKNLDTYVNLTNVYKHLLINNKSVYEIKVYYRKTLALVIPPQSNIVLYDVFNVSRDVSKSDVNVQLMFEGVPEAEIELINFGV